MAIKYPKDYALNGDIHNFPKKQYEKIVEIIDAVNDLNDGTITPSTITPDGGALTVNGDLELGTNALNVGAVTSTSLAGPLNTSSITTDTFTVTQATSITTGVTVTKMSGVITTVSSTLAAGSSAEFTVTATGLVDTTSRVLTTVLYTGNGIPVCTTSDVASDSFKIKLDNAHASSAFNGALKVHFLIVK